MPVGAVGAGAGLDGGHLSGQGVAAGRVPETDGAGSKVDLVGNVVPDISSPLDTPLGLAANAPPKQSVRDARGAREPTGLELGEVAFEEGDLVLPGGGRGVDVLSHQGEVVVDLALVDGSGGLGDQLGAAHVLAVPVGRVVERDLGSLPGTSVGWVLVVRREVDIGRHRRRPVDVVLVRANLVAPGPLVQIGRRGHVVEAAIPQDGACRDRQHLGDETGENVELHGGSREGLTAEMMTRGAEKDPLVKSDDSVVVGILYERLLCA